MIRLRSQKLLSGVSTLAMLASFGMVSPALAVTVTGPGLFPAVSNGVTITDITILAAARLDVDVSGNSISNTGTVTSAADTIAIDASILFGNVFNSGTVTATGAFDGIDIRAASDIDGAIINSGIISGGQDGIEVNASTLHGGIQNNGAASQILGVANGILFTGDTVVLGGITNAGTIAGSAGNGISVNDAQIDFRGNITNSAGARIQGNGASNAAIDLALFDTYIGTISNSGVIEGIGLNATAILIGTGTFTGDITNSATTGTIQATSTGGVGIYVTGTQTGNIINSGLITAGNRGVFVTGTLTGEIQNNTSGTIEATVTGVGIAIQNTGNITAGIDNAGKVLANNTSGIGISLSAGTFAGGIENTGTISATGTDGQGIVISGGTFTGGIQNTGAAALIQADDTAVLISLATFNGDFNNSGTITSDDEDGVQIAATVSFLGNFINSGYIEGSSNGVQISTPVFTGNFTNSGSIVAVTGTGVGIINTAFGGNFTNDTGGVISGTNFGVALSGTTNLTGNVVNNGTITAGDDAFRIETTATLTGNLTNAGLIESTSEDALDINGTITGTITNSSTGIISGFRDGIDIDGTTGPINNSGTITGGTKGIDLSGGGATVITQTAGLIQGNNGAVTTALDLTNGAVDTFNGNGGTLDGNVLADAGDDFVMTPTGTFAYLRGTASGLDRFDMAGAGTALLGASARGGDGASDTGVTVGAATMAFSAGDLYIDDDTTVTLTGAYTQTSTGTLEFFLKEGTSPAAAGDYGSIISGAVGSLGNATDLAVYLDPATFAATGGLTTYDYQNVVQNIGAGGAGNTFANAADITTSSVFFTGVATNDGANIDITLTRLTFAAALGLIGNSQNNISVGGALDAIYTAGGFSTFGSDGPSNFEDLFITLYGAGLTAAEIKAILDDLGGAEHAQNQQMALNVTGQFNDFLGMRLDQTLGSSTGGGMAGLGGQQYADAETTASDGSAASRGGSHGLNRGPSGVSVWLRGFGQWVNVDADPNAAGYDQDTTGAAGGIDYAVANNATVGVAGSWSKTESEFDTAGDSSEMDSWAAGAYGSVGFGRMYVDGLVSYASHDVSTLRTVLDPVPGAPFIASSAYDATAWSAQGEFGMVFGLGRANIQPSVGLSYSDLTTDAFIETGDGGVFNLIVDESSAESFASTVALRASGEWKMGRTRVMPEIRVGWRHEFENDPHSFTAAFSEDPLTQFTIISSELQQDSAVVRAGATFGVTRNIEVFVNLNGQYSSDAAATNASGGLRLTW